MKIYLHIGAGKCASSSIQNYFSYNHTSSGFMYGCLREAGNIIFGDDVRNSAAISPGNYAVSWSLKTETDDDFASRLKKSLSIIAKKTDRLLLSCEGWNSKAENFNALRDVLKPYDVEVIFIVRPPVQWMNSAWWQWHQWSKNKVDPWANRANVSQGWLNTYEAYRSLSFVNKITVLALNKNILTDLGNVVGVEVVGGDKTHNTASSSELLNFFRMKRSLRKGAHDAQKEFILNKYLSKRSSSDWVLSAVNVRNILKNSKESCETLSTLISNEDIKDNPLWWNEDAYAGKVKGMSRISRPTRQTLASMLEEAYHIIVEMDTKVRFNNVGRGSVDEIFDIAVKLEKSNLEESYRLMKVARSLRPKGNKITQKLSEYEEVLFAKGKV